MVSAREGVRSECHHKLSHRWSCCEHAGSGAWLQVSLYLLPPTYILLESPATGQGRQKLHARCRELTGTPVFIGSGFSEARGASVPHSSQEPTMTDGISLGHSLDSPNQLVRSSYRHTCISQTSSFGLAIQSKIAVL